MPSIDELRQVVALVVEPEHDPGPQAGSVLDQGRQLQEGVVAPVAPAQDPGATRGAQVAGDVVPRWNAAPVNEGITDQGNLHRSHPVEAARIVEPVLVALVEGIGAALVAQDREHPRDPAHRVATAFLASQPSGLEDHAGRDPGPGLDALGREVRDHLERGPLVVLRPRRRDRGLPTGPIPDLGPDRARREPALRGVERRGPEEGGEGQVKTRAGRPAEARREDQDAEPEDDLEAEMEAVRGETVPGPRGDEPAEADQAGDRGDAVPDGGHAVEGGTTRTTARAGRRR